MESVLTSDSLTVKQQLVGRFINFFKTLLVSKSPEIQIVANMAGRCVRATTGGNLIRIGIETGLDPWATPSWRIRNAIGKAEVPAGDGWRGQLLRKLIAARKEMETNSEDTDEVQDLIESLCST